MPDPNPDNSPTAGSSSQAGTYHIDSGDLITLLSRDLYRVGPEVVIRELLRNATDAIFARQRIDPDHEGVIECECQPNGEGGYRLIVTDNGIGMDAKEVAGTLGKLGHRTPATKTNEEIKPSEINRRRIGLLSCFMLSPEIHMVSQSLDTFLKPFHWIGRNNGQWEVRTAEEAPDPGTRVSIDIDAAGAEQLPLEQVKYHLHKYGLYLPVTLRYRWGQGSTEIREQSPWEKLYGSSWDYARAGKELFSEPFLDGFKFSCVDTGVMGIAFIPYQSPPPKEEASHRLYHRRMWVGDGIQNLTPPHLSFLKCHVNTYYLKLNAAKDNLHQDETCSGIHTIIEKAFDEHLRRLEKEDPGGLTLLLGLHHSAMIAMSEASDFHLQLMMEHFPLTTTLGSRSALSILDETGGEIYYCQRRKDYDRLELPAILKGVTVVRASDRSDFDFLHFLAKRRPDLKIRLKTSNELLKEIQTDVSSPPDAEGQFLRFANLELATNKTKVSLSREDEPRTLGSLTMEAEESILRTLIYDDRSEKEEVETERMPNFEAHKRELILNRNHPVVSSMIQSTHLTREQIQGWVRVFYHHCLLVARERPEPDEIESYTEGLVSLWGHRGYSIMDESPFGRVPKYMAMPEREPQVGAEIWAKKSPPAKALEDLRWVLQNDSPTDAVAHRWFTFVMIVRTQGQDRFVGTLAYWILKNWEKKGVDITEGMDEDSLNRLLRTLAISIPLSADDPLVSLEQIEYLQDSLSRLTPKNHTGSIDHALFPLAMHRQLGREPSREHLAAVVAHWDEIVSGKEKKNDQSAQCQEPGGDRTKLSLSQFYCKSAIAQIVIEALISLGEIDEAISRAREATSLDPCLFFCDFAPKGYLSRLLEPLLERGEVKLAKEWEARIASTIHSAEGALAETGYRAAFLAKYGEMDRALELLKGALPHVQNRNIPGWRKLEFYRAALRALSVMEMETVDEEMNIWRLEKAFEIRNLRDSEMSSKDRTEVHDVGSG